MRPDDFRHLSSVVLQFTACFAFPATGQVVQCGKSYFRGDIQMEYVLGKHPSIIVGTRSGNDFD